MATTVSVLRGNGDGTFQTPQAFEAGSGPNDVAVGDFNEDGYQDLAVADYGPFTQRATTVSVLAGNGDGTFGPATFFGAGDGPSCVTIGDFNHDGRQDLAACNYRSNDVTILVGNGDGTFEPAGRFPVGVSPWDVVVYDFNGDLKSDLAVIGHWSDIVSILPGNGDGTFKPHIWFRTDRGPTGAALADFDGDGHVDLATANYFSTTISVLPGNGNGTFRPAQNFGVGMAPMGLAAGDFNRDGQPDLASGDYFSHSVSILINRTVLPQVATPALSPPAGTYTGSVTITITGAGGATVHYTTDGTAPTSSSPVYTGPVSVSETTTIQAMAAAEGMADSGVAGATYTIQQQAPTPAFSQPGGTYTEPIALSITIRDAAIGATIHYTTDGTAPTTASPVYTGPIFIKTATTIRTLAASSGMAESDVASATYTIGDPPPAGTPLDPWCVTTRWPRRQGDNKCRQDWPPLSSSPES